MGEKWFIKSVVEGEGEGIIMAVGKNITWKKGKGEATVGARKRDTLRNKVKQKQFFHSFIICFFTFIHIMLNEHIYKEKI